MFCPGNLAFGAGNEIPLNPLAIVVLGGVDHLYRPHSASFAPGSLGPPSVAGCCRPPECTGVMTLKNILRNAYHRRFSLSLSNRNTPEFSLGEEDQQGQAGERSSPVPRFWQRSIQSAMAAARGGWPCPWRWLSGLGRCSGTSPQITTPSDPSQTPIPGPGTREGKPMRREELAGQLRSFGIGAESRPERGSVRRTFRSQVSLKLAVRWQFRGGRCR